MAKKKNQNKDKGRVTEAEEQPRSVSRWHIAVVVASVVIVSAFAYWFRGRSTSHAADRPDVILVTIDTLRDDCVGYMGNAEVSTPFLDRLASEGMVFTNAHAHNVVTFPSHVNILTGMLPYQHGVRDNAGFVLAEDEKTIGHRMRDLGYATGAFVAAFPLDKRFGLFHGFDVYDDNFPKTKAPNAFVVAERPAREVLEPAVRWWKEKASGGRPRFMWVHIYEPHYPYDPPSPFKEQYPKNPYYAEVAAADDALAKYLGPILDGSQNLFAVVTSDHGEGLGEHGEATHGLFAYEETLKIPLLIWEKGRIEPGRRSDYVRHIDLVPTILDRVGSDIPPDLPGRTLFLDEGDRDTYFESLTSSLNLGWAPLIGMIHEHHKYIDLPVAELYDLDDDPDEMNNIVSESRRMTFRIRELMAQSAPSSTDDIERNISSEEAQQLLSLGYLTGDAAKKEYTEADDPKNLIEYYAQLHAVVEAYQRGESARAVSMAKELIEKRPEMTMAKDILAFALQEAEKPEEAIRVLQQSIADGTATDAMKRRLGLILSESGRAAEAVEILAPLDKAKDADMLNAYGIALADVGRIADAVAEFQKVLAFRPIDSAAHQNLGIVALRAGDLQNAEKYLRRALQIEERLPLAWNALGVVFAQTGRVDEAISAWTQSATLDPRQYDALFNLGVTAGRAGRYDVARSALEQFVKTAPSERYRDDIGAARQMLRQLDARGGGTSPGGNSDSRGERR